MIACLDLVDFVLHVLLCACVLVQSQSQDGALGIPVDQNRRQFHPGETATIEI